MVNGKLHKLGEVYVQTSSSKLGTSTTRLPASICTACTMGDAYLGSLGVRVVEVVCSHS